jgi:intracellular sulfur oxidation DsrE/DsrF family protein
VQDRRPESRYAPKDIHGFVSMVPMGDAEIIRLQQQGYGYMR